MYRKLWAEEQRAKMNSETQQDVDTIVGLLNSDGALAANRKFQEIIKLRGWKSWEAIVVADVARSLSERES